MKQHITIEQLNELSDSAKSALRDWCKDDQGSMWAFYEKAVNKWYDYSISGDDSSAGKVIRYPSGKEGKAYPLLSIGQMIEFLKNETNFNIDYSGLDDTWGVRLEEKEFGNKELCDALWSAVKTVLEKEE